MPFAALVRRIVGLSLFFLYSVFILFCLYFVTHNRTVLKRCSLQREQRSCEDVGHAIVHVKKNARTQNHTKACFYNSKVIKFPAFRRLL